MNLFKHIKDHRYWYPLLVAMLLTISWYYWFEWRTLKNFLEAIDHNQVFMADFQVFFYPMGKLLFYGYTPVPGYYYSTFFALILAPIGMLPPFSAIIVWGTIQLACLVALCIISIRFMPTLRPLGKVFFVGLYVTSFPIIHNISWGQVSIMLTMLVVASFYSYNNNKRVLAGILLAIAAAIKFYPSIFVVYFIFKRDIRTCMVFFLAAFVLYFAFPATVLGFNKWLEFENLAITAVINKRVFLSDANSQYIVNVVLRWIVIFTNQYSGNSVTKMLTFLGYGIGLFSIALVRFLQQRALCEKHGLPMVVIFLSMPFLIKTSWPHYFVYLPVCQVAVLSYYAALDSSLWGKSLIALPVLSMLLSSIFLLNIFPNWIIYNAYGMLFISNVLLLVAVFATIFIRPASIDRSLDNRI